MDGLNWFLGINGVAFLIVGLRALLTPLAAIAEPLGLEVKGVDGKNYLRSGTGGVSIAGGIVLMLAMWTPKLQLPAVVLVVTMLGGLIAGRAYSLVVDGAPGAVPWISGFLEALGLLFGVLWLGTLWSL